MCRGSRSESAAFPSGLLPETFSVGRPFHKCPGFLMSWPQGMGVCLCLYVCVAGVKHRGSVLLLDIPLPPIIIGCSETYPVMTEAHSLFFMEPFSLGMHSLVIAAIPRRKEDTRSMTCLRLCNWH